MKLSTNHSSRAILLVALLAYGVAAQNDLVNRAHAQIAAAVASRAAAAERVLNAAPLVNAGAEARKQGKAEQARAALRQAETLMAATVERSVLTDELLQRIAVELAALNPATTAQGWPPELGEIFLLSLVLQTLVENAVKHGLAPSLTGGEIRVAITRAAGGLYLARVSNTGQPLKSAPEHGGAGLANTQARLTLLYGARHQFALAADEAGRTTASFLFTGERFD